MKLTYHVYRPGRPVEHCEHVWDKKFSSLKPMINKLVEGNLEHVAVLHEGRRADMFVEGDGAGVLPVNEEATKIYHANSLSREPGADTSGWPKIYGTAVLFDQIVWS